MSRRMEGFGLDDLLSSLSKSSSKGSSFRVEDDEQALRWAAIERLPTYDRLRTAILKSAVDGEDGERRFEHREMDVRKLGASEKQEFIKRVLRVAEEDNQRLLRQLQRRYFK